MTIAVALEVVEAPLGVAMAALRLVELAAAPAVGDTAPGRTMSEELLSPLLARLH
jgi:hypothetical protein